MTVQQLVEKIIQSQDIHNILELNKQNEKGVAVGSISGYDTKFLILLMKLWCQRIDTLIKLDKEVNEGRESWRSHFANEWRGFTYEEYADLFNKHITSDEFPFYPIFNQLRKKKGGINTEKQRTYFTSHYELNRDDYSRVLLEEGFEELLEIFFNGVTDIQAHLPLSELFLHSLIIAQSGSGKTILLESIFFQMTKKYKSFSFVLIDPNGELAGKSKNHKHLKERCIYIEPFFQDGYTPTFNPFDVKNISLRNINNVAEQIILAFEEVFTRQGGEFTELMSNMLQKCIYFLLKRQHSTLSDLVSLLSCNEQLYLEAAQDDDYFNEYFLKPNNKQRAGLLARIRKLIDIPVLKNLLGGRSTFDLEKAINGNKVVIFNLGGLGEMSQVAFGKFIIANVKSIVRKRKNPSKKHTFLFVDEAPVFVGGSTEKSSIAFIFSKLRGYGLHLFLANQYVEQYGNQIKAVKQNSGIKILGGSEDSLEDMRKVFRLPNVLDLKKYEFYLKVKDKATVKMKSPSTLLQKDKKHYLSKSKEKELDKRLLKKYYRAIEEDAFSSKKSIETNTSTKVVPTTNSPNPDLGLFIKENEDG